MQRQDLLSKHAFPIPYFLSPTSAARVHLSLTLSSTPASHAKSHAKAQPKPKAM